MIKTVKEFTKEVNLFYLSPKDLDAEKEFKNSKCETCRALPGDRFLMIELDTNVEYSICPDCLLYILNGDIPEHLIDCEKEGIEEVNPEDAIYYDTLYSIGIAPSNEYYVRAHHEQEALDILMDYSVKKGYTGLYMTPEDEDFENEDYLSAGNNGYKFTEMNILIKEVK